MLYNITKYKLSFVTPRIQNNYKIYKLYLFLLIYIYGTVSNYQPSPNTNPSRISVNIRL